jgi:hypothetical protein
MHVTEGIRPFDTSEALPDCEGQCPDQGIAVVHLEAWVRGLENHLSSASIIIIIAIVIVGHGSWVNECFFFWTMYLSISNSIILSSLNQQGLTTRKNMTSRTCAVGTSSMWMARTPGLGQVLFSHASPLFWVFRGLGLEAKEVGQCHRGFPHWLETQTQTQAPIQETQAVCQCHLCL